MQSRQSQRIPVAPPAGRRGVL